MSSTAYRILLDDFTSSRAEREAAVGKMFATLRPHQQRLIADNHKRIAVRGRRRVGKSVAYFAKILMAARSKMGGDYAYISLTIKDSMRRLKRVATQIFGQDVHFSDDGVVTIPSTESQIVIGGMEKLFNLKRLRGDGWDGLVVDEIQDGAPETVKWLLESVIEPAMSDKDGWLCLSGTPGNRKLGTWWEISGRSALVPRMDADGVLRSTSALFGGESKAQEYEWSLHEWNWEDAPQETRDRDLARKRRKGWPDNHPVWVREYLNQWTEDNEDLACPHFDPLRNLWDPGKRSARNPFGLPEGYEWQYVCGMDLGFSKREPFGLTVAAYSRNHPAVFHVYEYDPPKPPVTLDEMARAYREAEALAGKFVAVLGDTQGKTGYEIAEALAAIHKIPIEKAKKSGYHDFLELLDSDLGEGRMFIMRGSKLDGQMRELVRDPKTGRTVKGQMDNIFDAWRYSWRDCYHRYADDRPPTKPVDVREVERELTLEKLRDAENERKALARQAQVRKNPWGENETWRRDDVY